MSVVIVITMFLAFTSFVLLIVAFTIAVAHFFNKKPVCSDNMHDLVFLDGENGFYKSYCVACGKEEKYETEEDYTFARFKNNANAANKERNWLK